MVSISLLLSAVLALATSQVTAIPSPQTGGPPEAISIFYADCTTNDQSRIPANDTSIASTDSTCYSFAFNGINQAFVSSGFTAVVYPASGCPTGTGINVAQSPALGGCQVFSNSLSCTVVPT